jgi:hypothetical protein
MGLMGLMAAARPMTHSTRFMPAQGRAFNMTNHQSLLTSHFSLLTPYPIGFVSTCSSSRCNSLILWMATCTSASVNRALMATLAW